MTKSTKVVIVMPAYNAAKTLEQTFRDIPNGSYDEIILVDDDSQDNTVDISKSLGIETFRHEHNTGYGGNQKTCYYHALEKGADIIVMLHPDYQYDPKAVPRMVEPIKNGEADMVIASRFLDKNPYSQGMPFYKYIANRFLTGIQNFIFRRKLSEYHSGYRAYSKRVLKTIPYKTFSDNFVFDAQMVAGAVGNNFHIKEIGIPTRYFKEASQTSFFASVRYGISTLITLGTYLMRYGFSRNKPK